MSFLETLRLEDLWDGEMRGTTVGETKVLLIHKNGSVFAFEDRCPHQAVKLSEGRIDGEILTCPAHEWQYDVRTGIGLNPKGVRLKSFPVKVEDGKVFVDVTDGGRDE